MTSSSRVDLSVENGGTISANVDSNGKRCLEKEEEIRPPTESSMNDIVQRFSTHLLFRIRSKRPPVLVGGANRVFPAHPDSTPPNSALTRGSSRVRIANGSSDEGKEGWIKGQDRRNTTTWKRPPPPMRRHKSSLSSISAFVGMNRRAMAELFDGQQMSGAWLRMLEGVALSNRRRGL